MFMDNSMTRPKIIKKAEDKNLKLSNFQINSKWSTVKITNLKSSSKDEEKAYALNYFLNNLFLEKTEKEISVRKLDNISAEYIFKYRLFYSDQPENRYASYSSIHSILASLVYDLPKVENENNVVTSLRENINEIRNHIKNGSSKPIIVSKKVDYISRYYKLMLKHLIVSDNELYKVIDVNSFKEIVGKNTGEFGGYTMDKK